MADLTSTFSSLSSTESSNGPSGSASVGSGLDENLRMDTAHLAAWRDQTAWGILTLTSVAGTNTITATLASAGSVTFGPTSYLTGAKFLLVPANTNTGATTLNITSPAGGSALGAKNVFSYGVACVGGELVQNLPYILEYDGTQLNILSAHSPAGTWTPAITFGGAAVGVTYSSRSGRYTKLGRAVFCEFQMVLSSKGSSTGTALLEGLPFSVGLGVGFSPGNLRWGAMTTSLTNMLALSTGGSGTTLSLEGVGAAAVTPTTLLDSDFANNSSIVGTFFYSV